VRGSSASRSDRPRSAVAGLAGLIAGLLLFDLLINLPGWSPAAPAAYAFAPSVDLLLVAAALMGAATASPGPRLGVRIVVCVLVVFLLVYAAGTRFGFGIPFRLFGANSAVRLAAGGLLCAAAGAAAAGLAWLSSRLVIHGFSHIVTRSVFLAVAALLTVLQVVSGRHVFTPSEVPRIVRAIGLF
jgi:hypothetical protein